ncbi:MAG: PD-(D/E)XK nuclease domain-containing protein, partial [Pseudobutyrivibrio sp.]|nr:PD-(D/E)XK nuclease domain-containing protein [Pseudobutyrivibrio sp.]
ELEFDRIKKWYDGYTVGAKHSIYNPYSVMQALETGQYKSYWRKTSAAEALMTYIDMNQDGLQDTIARLIAGEQIEVDTESFQNDVETFSSKDDVLTLLIHLGYLTYEEIQDSYDVNSDVLTGLVKIPNDEVRFEFEKILRKAAHKDLIALVARSDKLLEDTLSGDSDAVAKAIEEVHETEYAPTFYNNEQSLRYIVKMAYISCVDQYAKIEELPSGHGIADLVYLPKRRSKLPAMLIELKWNHQASGAIEQIKNKNYPRVLENYGGEIVLVGVSYREKDKQHTCAIERIKK